MIVHVAAAGEARGRVVLQIGCGEPSGLALEAAVRVAQAFGSEIETLFVESQQLMQLASYPFAREISLTGRSRRSISSADIAQDLRYVSQAVQRKLDALARAADVPVSWRVMRAEPTEAVAQACAECGPWNVVTLGAPFASQGAGSLAELFSVVTDATGIVLVGPKGRRVQGSVILVVESEEQIAPMLSAGERLAAACAAEGTAGDIVALLLGDDAERLARLEGHMRLVLAGRETVRLKSLDVRHGSPSVVAEALRRLDGGFVIAAFGGLAVPAAGDLAPLAAALECPLFLVR